MKGDQLSRNHTMTAIVCTSGDNARIGVWVYNALINDLTTSPIVCESARKPISDKHMNSRCEVQVEWGGSTIRATLVSG